MSMLTWVGESQYYLNKRRLAKHGYFTPEQFGRDWDLLEATEYFGAEVAASKIAGNYGSHTNVWGMALVISPGKETKVETV